jgi:3-hydroxyisobutyrate dehydrogenase-like beta-hydroxyacid dehydrogenase
MRIGFIGTGLMGGRMAHRLIQGEHQLQVYNRTLSKTGELAREGATVTPDPAAAAAGAGVLFTMLSDPQAVRACAFGTQGFMAALRPATLWVDCSTVNPSFSREMARLAETRGVHFLDAPVAGTIKPAEEGQLVFFVGGREEDLERCRPLLELMGRAVIHAGGPGMGTSLKMVVNLLLAGAMTAFSEALALGQALGLQRDFLMDTLLGGPVTAPFLAGKRTKIEESEYSPEFPLKWMVKDLHLVSVSAYERGVALPATAAVKELYTLAERLGYREKDFSALAAFLRSRAQA